MSDAYRAVSTSTTLTTGVASSVALVDSSKGHLLTMSSSVAWELSFSSASMAAGETIQLAAGESFAIDAEVRKTTVWVKQSSGGNVDLRHAYLEPVPWDES